MDSLNSSGINENRYFISFAVQANDGVYSGVKYELDACAESTRLGGSSDDVDPEYQIVSNEFPVSCDF